MVKTLKKCHNCHTLKDIQSFTIDKKRTDGFSHRCKECQNIFSKQHYQKNKHKYQASLKKNRSRNRLFLYNYKLTHPCVDCGEKDPVVLDFDHRNRGEKTVGVSKMVGAACSIKKIEDEISKCDVRCANCHRRRTVKQLGYYKDIIKN